MTLFFSIKALICGSLPAGSNYNWLRLVSLFITKITVCWNSRYYSIIHFYIHIISPVFNQPAVLAISVTPSIFLSFSTSLLSSSFPCMSNPRLIVAIPFLLTRLFINLTSMLASVNILDISTISPVLLPAKILISVLYLSADESTCSHSASMRRSLSFSGN